MGATPNMATVIAVIAILGTFASSITYLVSTASAAEAAKVKATEAHIRIDDFADEFDQVQEDVAVLKEKSITAEKDRKEIKDGLKELLRRTPAR